MKSLFKVSVSDSKFSFGTGLIDDLLVIAKDAQEACRKAEKFARAMQWSKHHISSVEMVRGTVIS